MAVWIGDSQSSVEGPGPFVGSDVGAMASAVADRGEVVRPLCPIHPLFGRCLCLWIRLRLRKRLRLSLRIRRGILSGLAVWLATGSDNEEKEESDSGEQWQAHGGWKRLLV